MKKSELLKIIREEVEVVLTNAEAIEVFDLDPAALLDEVLGEEKDDDWIQDAEADIERRGTEGVCTGEKFGGPTCRPGTKRYNLAKTFRKMARKRKKD